MTETVPGQTRQPTASVLPRTRGKSKRANWRRPQQVAVIVLELDVAGDPTMRRRLERHWDAVFRLRRALQRDASSLCRAYVAAHRERVTPGPKSVRERLGLDRKGIEARAKTHVEQAGWMRRHFTKATALHVADEVWQTCDRLSGHRHGIPRIGTWWDFTRIPGRARSHTKTQPVWETYRLVGCLQGHLDAYSIGIAGITVAEAAALGPGNSVLAAPKHLPTPQRGDGSWWGYEGPLAVVYTGLPPHHRHGGDLVLPVRLPQGSGQFERLRHFLADQSTWRKIDLVRVLDRAAPGGWRYQAHLTVLGAGWVGPTTAEMRAHTPTDRVGGVDGNVSNLAVASLPADSEGDLITTHIPMTVEQREVIDREAKKTRDRQRAMQRSRRAGNAAQYKPSKKQQARAERRKAAGLPTKTVQVPGGARLASSRGIPTQAYRKDTLSKAYRVVRADHPSAASSAVRRRDAYARQTAQAIVAAHGPNLVTEDVDIRTWMLRWGRGIAAFTPGRLLAHLADECAAAGGALTKASTFTTALSQHCLCGNRAKKPLSQRRHACPCGIEGDRDLVSAVLAATVVLTDPNDPRTASINHRLREHAQRMVLDGRTHDVTDTAQQEGPVRSTVHHNPALIPRTGEDGSLNPGAPAGQGEHPAPPRNRSHGYPWGRRRHRRTSRTPAIREPAPADS